MDVFHRQNDDNVTNIIGPDSGAHMTISAEPRYYMLYHLKIMCIAV